MATAVPTIRYQRRRMTGRRVGMYVEQDPTNPVDTHRQGEFTADAYRESCQYHPNRHDRRFCDNANGRQRRTPRTSDRWVVDLKTGLDG